MFSGLHDDTYLGEPLRTVCARWFYQPKSRGLDKSSLGCDIFDEMSMRTGWKEQSTQFSQYHGVRVSYWSRGILISSMDDSI